MNFSKSAFLIMLVLVCHSCSSDDDASSGSLNDSTFFEADYDTSLNSLSVDTSLFNDAVEEGPLDYAQIDEASGLAISRQNPDLMWTHNDSGDLNRIFLLHKDGTHQGTFRILGTGNRDWEDMAIGGGPDESLDYLYIGDFGDNNAVYDVKQIHRLPEPDITTATTDVQWTEAEGAETINFVYPDDVKMDAESLLLDPFTLDLFIVTKREFPVTVYRLPYPQSTTETIVAEKYGTLPFTFATAGDISADGKTIVLKTKERIFMWSRNENESVADAFQREPIRLPYLPEPQGEAIAFPEGGNVYFTLSEARGGVTPIIYSYERK